MIRQMFPATRRGVGAVLRVGDWFWLSDDTIVAILPNGCSLHIGEGTPYRITDKDPDNITVHPRIEYAVGTPDEWIGVLDSGYWGEMG